MSRSLTWYGRRLSKMSPAEVAARGCDEARRLAWARRQVRLGAAAGVPHGTRAVRVPASSLPPDARGRVSSEAREAVVRRADRLLAGSWSILGVPRSDILAPDWFADPVTGRRAPQGQLAFRVDHRDESLTGNVKSVWELSRHHHLTVLASAWWLTGDDTYAEVVADQLRSWWASNPFLSGVHWTSGIELGIRLISWAWVRRLLADWPGVSELFEHDEAALRQLWWHQTYLDSFRSTGSSANNHVVAEAAGRLVAACAFPWFAESDRWRRDARRQLEGSLTANTFPTGLNRELATDYHRFVTELGLVALVEADAAGDPLGDGTRLLLTASLDTAAAVLDVAGRPPRQGDGDEGRALVLDDPDLDPWAQLLGLGAAVVGPLPWWPDVPGTVGAAALGALVTPRATGSERPAHRPQAFPDAGMHLLRTPPEDGPEIWCRCDGGPHGFLAIAAHAHADALSVEVRHGGVEVLVDPGTYCYHGEPAWRSYFRSTLAHNTVEVAGTNQSTEGGPFLWSRHARSRVDRADVGDDLPVQTWTGSHDGYVALDPGCVHTRSVTLDAGARTLSLRDQVTATTAHDVRLALHLGPQVTTRLLDGAAELTWPAEEGLVRARIVLPAQLCWTAHRGEEDPVLGWYSPRFGERVPTTTLVGAGEIHRRVELLTTLTFSDQVVA